MSRWSRNNDDSGNLLPRNGSFSSSSQSYQQLAEDESQPSQQSSASALPISYPPSVSPPPTYSQYQDGSAPAASALPDSFAPQPTKTITVNLRTLSGQVMPLTFSSLSGVTVLDIKRRAEEVHQIPVSFQRLIFSGRELVDGELATSYGMDDGSMLHLLLRQASVPQPVSDAAAVDASGQPIALPVGADGHAMFNGVAIPIQPAVDPYAASDEDTTRLNATMQLSRIIKILALIDFLWLVLLANAQPLLLAGGVLALAGFWGAHSYNKHMIGVFSLYLVGSIALRIYFMVSQPSTEFRILLTLGSLVDLYLLRVVGVFYRLCARLSPSEKAELQMLNRPNFQMN